MGDEISHSGALQFRGLARVDLAALNFQHASSKEHRDVLEQHVTRLVNIFRTEGCKRTEASRFVKARVDERQLDEALASQNLDLPQRPPQDWTVVPILELPRLDCLNGWHRVVAARQWLDQNDQWWIAELYTSGMALGVVHHAESADTRRRNRDVVQNCC